MITKRKLKSVSDLLEISIPRDLVFQSSGGTSRGDLTKAYYWHRERKYRISRFLLDRELVELNQILSKLNLGKKIMEVADEAHDIFRKAVVADISKGRPIGSLIAAVIYAACRRLAVPANLNEICENSNAKRKSVARCYRIMLAMRIFTVPVPDYSIHLERLWKKLDSFGLTEKDLTKALQIFRKAKSLGILGGRNPVSIAAASIYLACKPRLAQWEIAKEAGISEVTIRNNCKRLKSRV